MKVLQVHCRYRLAGGEDAVVEREAGLLRAAGHEVQTLLVDNPQGVRRTLLALAAAPWNRQAAADVRATALAVRPDIVHVHNMWFALSPAVLPAVHQVGLPVVVTLHNYRAGCVSANLFRDGAPCHDCLGRGPWPGVRHRCYRGSVLASTAVAATIAVARRRRVWEEEVDAVLVPSARARELLVQAGLPMERVQVVPNVVADPGPRDRSPADSTAVLYVGRLTREKGVDLLLDAWSRARPRGLVLEVVGEGELEPQVRATEGVRLLGRLAPEQVAVRMRSARALVVPSAWDEPFGLVVAEGAAAGLPVLAARNGALPELLAACGSEHWLVEHDGWSAALTALAPGGMLAADLEHAGSRARAAYERHWTAERGLARLLEVYLAVAANG